MRVGMIWHHLTTADARGNDAQSQANPAGHRPAIPRTLARPARTTTPANLLSVVGLISVLILVWTVIVTA